MNENYPGYERRSSTWLREISAKFLKLYLLHIHLGQQALSEVSILVVLDLLAHDRVRDSFVQEHLLVEAHRLELLRQHQRAAFLRFVAREIPPAREVLLAHRGVTQHLRIVVRVLLFARRVDDLQRMVGDDARSEVHTSELQSLMRISYAVFCLKKKK